MIYSYEFVKINPKQLWVQLKFSSEGKDDVFKNAITDDFSEEALHNLAKSYAPEVIDTWTRIDNAPESVEVQEKVRQEQFKPTIRDPRPPYDESLFNLVPIITETDTNIVNGWEVVEKTDAEKQSWLDDWRSRTQVSMRQARLALIQQELLQQVNSAIASLSEPEKSIVETEWEYASVVDRSSPWIASMTIALGLTDEQMDDLFKLAATL